MRIATMLPHAMAETCQLNESVLVYELETNAHSNHATAETSHLIKRVHAGSSQNPPQKRWMRKNPST